MEFKCARFAVYLSSNFLEENFEIENFEIENFEIKNFEIKNFEIGFENLKILKMKNVPVRGQIRLPGGPWQQWPLGLKVP